ncbi:MAG: ABC transporter permease [Bacteroidetes bacterium CG_4_10_14_3_um_filter_31_20]|nr:MAG: ABC transporter permease [Bacteroidetes bacterium CG_4_10_14_3_um_filter_31_20]
MRIILFIIQKEFLQIFRNKSMLPVIFVMPIIQLIILVNAATFEMKNIELCIVDKDLSTYSRNLSSKFEGSPYFVIEKQTFSAKEAIKYNDRGVITAAIVIPKGFERKIVRNEKNIKIQVLVDAINGTNAGVSQAYIISIIQDYNKQILSKFLPVNSPGNDIETSRRFWYNPELNYKTFMVPGILVLLITIISFILSGMNIVREKEMGTIEQINVTPIKKYQFIAGKLIPFWIIGLFELAFGLTIGKLLFDIPLVGNLGLVFGFAAIYLIVLLALGLLVSTIVNTQQQAMFISFFFMVVFILMSGLFTGIENMPEWAQIADKANPLAYFIEVMRMILLKGSGISDILYQLFAIIIFAVLMIWLAVWRYKKIS